jgi:hypothetical protein
MKDGAWCVLRVAYSVTGRNSVPLESGDVIVAFLAAQVVGFSRGAKGAGENWLNSHIFPPFLASSMGSFLDESGRRPVSSGLQHAKKPENPLSSGIVRFARRGKWRESKVQSSESNKSGQAQPRKNSRYFPVFPGVSTYFHIFPDNGGKKNRGCRRRGANGYTSFQTGNGGCAPQNVNASDQMRLAVQFSN